MQASSEITISDIMERHGITVEVTAADSNPHFAPGGFQFNHWTACIRVDDGSVTVPYSTGLALDEPEGADVLECLVMDARGVSDGQSFEEWAGDYGFDPDSRKAEATYRVIVKQTRRVRNLIGSAFDELLALEL